MFSSQRGLINKLYYFLFSDFFSVIARIVSQISLLSSFRWTKEFTPGVFFIERIWWISHLFSIFVIFLHNSKNLYEFLFHSHFGEQKSPLHEFVIFALFFVLDIDSVRLLSIPLSLRWGEDSIQLFILSATVLSGKSHRIDKISWHSSDFYILTDLLGLSNQKYLLTFNFAAI